VSEEAFDFVFETLLVEAWHNATVAAVVFDDARTFLTANRAYLDLLGYSRKEMRDMKAGANLLVDEAGRLAYLDLFEREGQLHGRAPIHRKDGSVLIVDYFVVPTRVAHLPCSIALMWPTEKSERPASSPATSMRSAA
jgi:PAS domain S-box-containing protein